VRVKNSLSVTVSNPRDGQRVFGVVSVESRLEGAVAQVANVELRADGRLLQTDETYPFGFDWDSTAHANGRVTLELTANTRGGEALRSRPVTVEVDNGTPLWASLTSPVFGATVSGVVRVTARAGGGRNPQRAHLYVVGNWQPVAQDLVPANHFVFQWDSRPWAGRRVEVYAVVIDANGDSVTTNRVPVWVAANNQAPVARIQAAPLQGVSPLTVQFGSAGSRDPDGRIVSFVWNFGDGTQGQGPAVAHTYQFNPQGPRPPQAARFTATLTVTDDHGARATTSVAIEVSRPQPPNPPPNRPPAASVQANPVQGKEPLTVQFNGSGSSDADGRIVSYVWNFGDGGSGSGGTATHLYAAAGVYRAVLTVTDDKGANGAAAVTITVQRKENPPPPVNQPPQARVGANPARGNAPLTVAFSGAGSSDDGRIVSYDWNFGDGSTGSGVTASHTYQRPGNFTATLTIKDDKGAQASASATIQVLANQPPPPAPNKPPSLRPQAQPAAGRAPLNVTFTANAADADGRVASIAWDFGDGSTGSGETASHTFNKPGHHRVIVTATDDKGAQARAMVGVTVQGRGPKDKDRPSGFVEKAEGESFLPKGAPESLRHTLETFGN
jgi:PKD repeat protein